MRTTQKTTLALLLIFSITLFGAGSSVASSAATVTKDQVISMALEKHPGKVVKAYKYGKRCQEISEIEIDGNDGKEWELYYDMSGNLIAEDVD